VPRARRRGVASALLDVAHATAPDVHLDVVAGLDAAVALYRSKGYTLVRSRLAEGRHPFELRSYRLSQAVDLDAVPLLEADQTEPKLVVPYLKPLDPALLCRLPSPLYPSLGFVFRLGGRRYVARRPGPPSETHRTLPRGTWVRCRLLFDAQPAWAFPRRVNTYRAKPLACTEEGPCTCNADCSLA